MKKERFKGLVTSGGLLVSVVIEKRLQLKRLNCNAISKGQIKQNTRSSASGRTLEVGEWTWWWGRGEDLYRRGFICLESGRRFILVE